MVSAMGSLRGRAAAVASVLMSSVFGSAGGQAADAVPVPTSQAECLNLRGVVVAQVVLLPDEAQRNILGEHGEVIQLLVNLCEGGQYDQAQRLAQEFVDTDFTVEDNQKPPERKDCFVTTACCDALGLADDCFELAALRRFRDGPLAALPGGAADIALYYALAPALLAGLRRAGPAATSKVLRRMYVTHILPCALLARCGFARAARRRYHHLMLTLMGEVARLAPAG